MSEQAKALELAAHLDCCASVDFDGVFVPSAAELRRLHSVNAELLEALELVIGAHEHGCGMDDQIAVAKLVRARALGQ